MKKKEAPSLGKKLLFSTGQQTCEDFCYKPTIFPANIVLSGYMHHFRAERPSGPFLSIPQNSNIQPAPAPCQNSNHSLPLHSFAQMTFKPVSSYKLVSRNPCNQSKNCTLASKNRKRKGMAKNGHKYSKMPVCCCPC